MTGDLPPIAFAREPTDEWYEAYLPPPVDLAPFSVNRL